MPSIPTPPNKPAITATTSQARNDTINATKTGKPFAPLIRAFTAERSAQNPNKITVSDRQKAMLKNMVMLLW
jgi:hypothetical protein